MYQESKCPEERVIRKDEYAVSLAKKLFIRIAQYVVVANLVICASAPANGSDTLAKAVEGMSPQLSNTALSMTLVRTLYSPTPLSVASGQNEVQQTTISEILVDSSRIKESICDSRSDGAAVKQYAFHYSNNGKTICTYDSKKRYGSMRAVRNRPTNVMDYVTSPTTPIRRSRFVSRRSVELMAEYCDAEVVSEEKVDFEGMTATSIVGTYGPGKPGVRFRMTVVPEMGNAVTYLREEDEAGRVLCEVSRSQFKKIETDGATVWLPGSTRVKKYNHDDDLGSTVQEATQDMLDVKAHTNATENDFTITFPPNARRVYDATVGARYKVSDVELADFVSMSTAAPKRIAAVETSDVHGKAMIDKAIEQYQEEAPQGKTLQLPKDDRWRNGIIAACGLLCITIGWQLLRRRRNVPSRLSQP
jgi:hypothetical protein